MHQLSFFVGINTYQESIERSVEWGIKGIALHMESLVPVEIIAVENQEKPTHLTLRDVLSRFCVYRMHGTPPPPPLTRSSQDPDGVDSDVEYDEDPEIPSAEVFDMPHHDFDGSWEE